MIMLNNKEDIENDRNYIDALEVVARNRKVSTSILQKCLSIGYTRAKRLLAQIRNAEFILSNGLRGDIYAYINELSISNKNTLATVPLEPDITFVEEPYLDAINLAKINGYISINLMKKVLNIGYPRAARIMDELVVHGEIERNKRHGKSRYLKQSYQLL